jgi:hypothetical protein
MNIKPIKSLEIGKKYDGKITRIDEKIVEKDGEEITYCQISVRERVSGMNVFFSYPAVIASVSMLGQLLQRFGVDISDTESEITIENVLKTEEKVTFLVELNKGGFVQGNRRSLMPLK